MTTTSHRSRPRTGASRPWPRFWARRPADAIWNTDGMSLTEIPRIDLLDGAFYAGDPHPTYEWMRKNRPVYFDEAHGVWGMASYAAVLGASKDPSTFSNAGGIRPDNGPLPMMIDMDDPAHWKRRKLVNRGFTPGRVRAIEGEIRDKCDAIIDQVCERGECDFVRDV